MPYEITFDNIPVGYALTATKSGEYVKVANNEFISSEDGDLFISRLEGIPQQIISKLPEESGIKPSSIDHLIAIIRKDKTAIVYVNEVEFRLLIQPKRKIKKGDGIFDGDIISVEKLLLKDITFSDECAIVFIFSVGWRKGFFYDLSPLHNENVNKRDYNTEILFGKFYAYLLFQNYYKITDSDWDYLIDHKWFPFISLKRQTVKQILNYTRQKWDIDELLPTISDELHNSFNSMVLRWKKNSFIKSHIKIITSSIERYKEKDYIGAISVLYPRIEGILRSFYFNSEKMPKATQKNLVKSTVESNVNPYSLLLPEKFSYFLSNVFFAHFNPKDPKGLSRHTVSHGVVDENEFSLKGATMGFLILDQLSFYLQAKIAQQTPNTDSSIS